MKKIFLLLSVSVLLVFNSCSDPLPPSLQVTSIYFEVPYTGGDVEFSLTSNMPWSITPENENDVITISSTSGGIGSYDIKVTVPETSSLLTTKHNIKVSSHGEKNVANKFINISQQYKPGLIVTAPKLTASANGEVLEITVFSNDKWSLICSEPSVVFYPSNDTILPAGERTILVTVPACTSAREIELTFSIPNTDISERLIINQ